MFQTTNQLYYLVDRFHYGFNIMGKKKFQTTNQQSIDPGFTMNIYNIWPSDSPTVPCRNPRDPPDKKNHGVARSDVFVHENGGFAPNLWHLNGGKMVTHQWNYHDL